MPEFETKIDEVKLRDLNAIPGSRQEEGSRDMPLTGVSRKILRKQTAGRSLFSMMR